MGGRAAVLRILLELEKLNLLCPPQKDVLDAAQAYQKSGQSRSVGQAGWGQIMGGQLFLKLYTRNACQQRQHWKTLSGNLASGCLSPPPVSVLSYFPFPFLSLPAPFCSLNSCLRRTPRHSYVNCTESCKGECVWRRNTCHPPPVAFSTPRWAPLPVWESTWVGWGDPTRSLLLQLLYISSSMVSLS